MSKSIQIQGLTAKFNQYIIVHPEPWDKTIKSMQATISSVQMIKHFG